MKMILEYGSEAIKRVHKVMEHGVPPENTRVRRMMRVCGQAWGKGGANWSGKLVKSR
jgi:hypothetical protein